MEERYRQRSEEASIETAQVGLCCTIQIILAIIFYFTWQDTSMDGYACIPLEGKGHVFETQKDWSDDYFESWRNVASELMFLSIMIVLVLAIVYALKIKKQHQLEIGGKIIIVSFCVVSIVIYGHLYIKTLSWSAFLCRASDHGTFAGPFLFIYALGSLFALIFCIYQYSQGQNLELIPYVS